jgi:hypothetical protein
MHKAAEAQINDHAQTFLVTPFIRAVSIIKVLFRHLSSLLWYQAMHGTFNQSFIRRNKREKRGLAGQLGPL